MLRGRDDRGKDLIIAREYLSQGMRERAAEIVSLDLGPRTDHEIESRLRAEVEQDRFTSIDRSLLREVNEPGGIRSGADSDAFTQTLRAGRLQKLRRLGLAEEVAPGRWQLADDLEPVLRRMGERGDIIKTLHRGLIGMSEHCCHNMDHATKRPEEHAKSGFWSMIGEDPASLPPPMIE